MTGDKVHAAFGRNLTTAPARVPPGFGLALYQLRKARDWSLRRAAREAGIDVKTVMSAEQGRSVQLVTAIRLASAYGTTVGALLDGSGT